jgi:hypothetical protein
MRLDPGTRMAKAAERTATATERAAKALSRRDPRAPAKAKTAGDVIRETAETLGGAVGLTDAQATALNDELVAVWTRHYEASR